MNKQIKLIRCVCVAGIAGLLAAGGAGTHGSVTIFTEGLAAEEGQVIILSSENIETLKMRLQEDPNIVITLEDGTPIDLEYLESLEASGESIILKESDIAANSGILEAMGNVNTPEILGESEDSQAEEDQEVSGILATPEIPTTSEGSGELGTPENPDTSEGTEEAEVPEKPEITGNLGESDISENPKLPATSDDSKAPDHSNGSNVSDKPEASENPENPSTPADTDKPSVSGDAEESKNPNEPASPDEPIVSDGSKEPGTSDQPDSSDQTKDPNQSGTPEDPSQPEQPKDPNQPEQPKDPSQPAISEDPSQSETPEDPNQPEQLKDPSQSETPKDPNQPEQPEDPSQPEQPEDPNQPNQSEDPDISELPNDTEDPDVSEDYNILDYIDFSDLGEKEFAGDFSSGLNDMIVNADQFQPEQITPERIRNATVILNRELVKLPKIVEDFRFWTVTRKYAFAKEDIMIREKIPAEEVGEDMVRAVGSLKKDGLLYILKEENDGWLYVESGRVRGFVRSEKVITGKEANPLLETYQNEAKEKAEERQVEYTGIEDMVSMAEELIPWRDNEAFTYLRATVNQTVVEKRYAVAKEALIEVKEEKDAASRVVGVIPPGGLCYILEGLPEDEAENEDRDTDVDEDVDGTGMIMKTADEPEGSAVNKTTGNEVSGNEIFKNEVSGNEISENEVSENEVFENETTENEISENEFFENEISENENFKNEISENEIFENEVSENESEEEPSINRVKEESDIEEEGWIYIESGDVRGFVWKDSIIYGEEITKQVEEAKEDSYLLAEEKVKSEDNKACYYTLTSTKPGVPSGEIRKSMIEYASQFIGNPYVWGGTSLTDGADCSGFVQTIYRQYGYELPRVACDQAEYGIKIPVEDALPGDLIFYSKNGYIHHVVMYAGGGKTIEAMSSKTGIVMADVRTDSAVWATRILDDNGYEYAGGSISDVNTTPDMYGTDLGTFELTYYCACEICCDVETGITATGAPVVEGRTIAVDPRVIPYGTQVIIGGHLFTAEDCGGAIKGNHIDIYVNDHAKALALGVNYANVYLRK